MAPARKIPSEPSGGRAPTKAKAKAAPPSPRAKKAKVAAEEPAATEALPRPTITDALLADHRDTLALLGHFKQASKSADKLLMEKLVDAIAVSIRLHSQAEIDVLYPFVEKTLGKAGKDVSKHSVEEHTSLEEHVMAALELRKEGGAELAEAVDTITKEFTTHAKYEEDEAIPQLMQTVEAEETTDLAQAFFQAKHVSPLTPEA